MTGRCITAYKVTKTHRKVQKFFFCTDTGCGAESYKIFIVVKLYPSFSVIRNVR